MQKLCKYGIIYVCKKGRGFVSDNKKIDISDKIKNMSPDEFWAKAPAETPRMKRQRTWKKVKKVAEILGLDSLGEASSKSRGRHHGGGAHSAPPPQSSSAAFRQEQAFDYEQWVRKEMAAEAYSKLVDGKGDHDCGHDHER